MYEEIIPFKVRMEQEEESEARPIRKRIGFKNFTSNDVDEKNLDAFEMAIMERKDQQLYELLSERKIILENSVLKTSEKLKLLENNRKTTIIVKGGSIRKTENIVYSVLIFSGVLILVLALLNTFSNLSNDVTLAFMGTVLGGTIATITQKLGKL